VLTLLLVNLKQSGKPTLGCVKSTLVIGMSKDEGKSAR
jgi:hypothetical protein